MVKQFTCFLFLIAIVCMYSNAQSVRTYDVFKTTGEIVIDGEMDPIWELVDTVMCPFGDEDEDDPPSDEWDLSMNVRMLWNDTAFFFFGVINDDYTPDSSEYDAGVPEWQVDNVEVYFDPANAKTSDMNNHTQLRFEYRVTPPFYRQWSEGGFDVSEPIDAWAKTETGDGWQMEVAFDIVSLMNRIDSTLAEDHQMGWNVVCIDNDDPMLTDVTVLRWVETGGDSWNNGALMGTITLKSDVISDIKKVTKKAALKVYPNPAKDYVRISDISSVQRIEISNIIGQDLWSVDNPASDIIDLSGLREGMYLIRLYSDENTVTTVKVSKN